MKSEKKVAPVAAVAPAVQAWQGAMELVQRWHFQLGFSEDANDAKLNEWKVKAFFIKGQPEASAACFDFFRSDFSGGFSKSARRTSIWMVDPHFPTNMMTSWCILYTPFSNTPKCRKSNISALGSVIHKHDYS